MRGGNAALCATARGGTPCAGAIHIHAYTRSEMLASPAAQARSMCSRYCVCTNNTIRRRTEGCAARCDAVRLRSAREECEPARNFKSSEGESNANEKSG